MEVSYSEVRQNLKHNILAATLHHEPIFITSHKKRQAVLLSYEDFASLEETAYLLRSPAMAKRLIAIQEDLHRHQNLETHDLVDDEA